MLLANYEARDGTAHELHGRDGLGNLTHHPAEMRGHIVPELPKDTQRQIANHAPLATRRRPEPASWATGNVARFPAMLDTINAS